MKIEWNEERGPDADAPDFHRVGIREDGVRIIDPIWHGPRTLEEIKAGQEVYFKERQKMKRYNWETPTEKLPSRLRRIVETNNGIFCDNWIDLTPEERSRRIKDGYDSLADLCGKLNQGEIDYLEDANYHSILEFLTA